MEARIDDACLVFTGRLDETDTRGKIIESLDSAWAKINKVQVRLAVDFTGVIFANSLGIREWCQAISEIDYPIVYVRAPMWLVEQMGIVQELITENTDVESFYAPYFSVSQNKMISKLLKVGDDVPVLDSYDGYELPPELQFADLRPDFEPEAYFFFLTDLYGR